MVLQFNNPFFRIIKNFYWGLNFTRISRLFTVIGCVPYISFVFLLKKEKLLKKRLVALQNIVKKYFIFDRILKRNYQMRTDYLFKSGNYRGMRLRSGLPVHGQRTHTNASTAKRLNRLLINSLVNIKNNVKVVKKNVKSKKK